MSDKQDMLRTDKYYEVRSAARRPALLCFAVLISVAILFLSSSAANAKKVRTEEEPRESGTLITIETLEKISSTGATGTVEMNTATDTAKMDSATATADMETATDTVEAAGEPAAPEETPAPAEEPAVEVSPTVVEAAPAESQEQSEPETAQEPAPEKNDAVPEAVKSSRYESAKTTAVSDGTAPATPPAVAQPEPVAIQPPVDAAEAPAPEPVVEPAAPEESPVAEEKQPAPVAPDAEAAAEPAPVAAAEDVSSPATEPAAGETPAEAKPAEAKQPDAVVGKPAPAPGLAESIVPETQPAPDAQPAPEPVPAKAAAPAAAKSPAGKYTVRSGPITDEAAKNALVERLRRHDYHPVVREETFSGKDSPGAKKYFVIEMGNLDNVAMATRLLLEIREVSDEFFIVGGDADSSSLAPENLAKIFPHNAGEGGDNSLSLLSNYFEMRGQLARSETEPVSAGATGKPGKLMSTRKMKLIERETTPVMKLTGEDRRLRLQNRLREVVWEMRAGGFDVEVEEELAEGEEPKPQFLEPEGVLVGMFETEQEALELAAEINGSGYGVNVVHKVMIDGMYHVYADPVGASREITIIDPVAIADHMATEDFNPPPDPADALLRLMGGDN